MAELNHFLVPKGDPNCQKCSAFCSNALASLGSCAWRICTCSQRRQGQTGKGQEFDLCMPIYIYYILVYENVQYIYILCPLKLRFQSCLQLLQFSFHLHLRPGSGKAQARDWGKGKKNIGKIWKQKRKRMKIWKKYRKMWKNMKKKYWRMQ